MELSVHLNSDYCKIVIESTLKKHICVRQKQEFHWTPIKKRSKAMSSQNQKAFNRAQQSFSICFDSCIGDISAGNFFIFPTHVTLHECSPHPESLLLCDKNIDNNFSSGTKMFTQIISFICINTSLFVECW